MFPQDEGRGRSREVPSPWVAILPCCFPLAKGSIYETHRQAAEKYMFELATLLKNQFLKTK